MFANHSSQKFVAAVRVAVNIVLEIGIGLDYIEIVSNWQSYFRRTSIFPNEVSVLEIMDIPAICIPHNVFSSERTTTVWRRKKKKIIARKYRCVIKVISRDQSNPIFRGTCTSCTVARWTFLFPPLAKLRIFLVIISSRVDKFLSGVETVRCLSTMAATFSGCMYRIFTRDAITRSLDENIS